ncbi:TPA: YopX family protein [Streptococcus suis]
MVVPKFRAWVEAEETMHPVLSLDWSGIDDDLTVFVPMGRNSSRAVSIDNAILMQSTGVLDKNGKEIFEGDVVKFNDTWNEYDYEGYVDGASEGENFTEILKTEDGFSFGRTKIPESSVFYFLDDEHMKFSEIVKSDDFSMVIVGNIYENPELLETQND